MGPAIHRSPAPPVDAAHCLLTTETRVYVLGRYAASRSMGASSVLAARSFAACGCAIRDRAEAPAQPFTPAPTS